MQPLLRRLWGDDHGSIISVEMILIIAILIFGLVPGLVALRNSTSAFLGSIANTFTLLSPDYATTQCDIDGDGTPETVYYQVSSTAKELIVGSQIPPEPANLLVIPPAP